MRSADCSRGPMCRYWRTFAYLAAPSIVFGWLISVVSAFKWNVLYSFLRIGRCFSLCPVLRLLHAASHGQTVGTMDACLNINFMKQFSTTSSLRTPAFPVMQRSVKPSTGCNLNFARSWWASCLMSGAGRASLLAVVRPRQWASKTSWARDKCSQSLKPVLAFNAEQSAQRCLVPFSTFAEPKPNAGREELWFTVNDAPASAFAGIWRPSVEGKVFAFLTCEPNPLVAPIHP